MSLGLEELLTLEQQGRQRGTGLQASDLLGCWQLQRVWPKGSQHEAVLGGWLLRGLAARLEITATQRAEGTGDAPQAQGELAQPELQLSNAVTLGPLELRFRGPGRLQGRRPLLMFQFDQLQLSLAGQVLLQRQLPAPEPKRLPFFALISREPEGWLSARGRGGGLAQWRLRPQQVVHPAGAHDGVIRPGQDRGLGQAEEHARPRQCPRPNALRSPAC